MRVTVKPGLVGLALTALLLLFGLLSTNPVQADELQPDHEIVLLTSLPQKDGLTLVAVLPVVVDEEMVGVLAVYDDVTTERPADYVELYDSGGGLLAFSWFDQFGIERTAVDRSLVEPGQNELEGTFVLVLKGELV